MRSECLFNDEKLHVSEVYHVVDGKQINIENKVELFRRLGREKKLFCPCGCGENVVLVAGPRNVRRQHFRLIGDRDGHRCEYEEESELSIASKGALKCWLENSVSTESPQVRYRVPICEVEDSDRRFELTFYESGSDFGVVYARLDSAIASKKIELVDEFAHTKVLVVAAKYNEDTDGQYPEYMIRIQRLQGYCAYLIMDEETPYEEIEMEISFYGKNLRGSWDIIPVICAPLSTYTLSRENDLFCNGNRILTLVETEQAAYNQKQQQEKEQIKREQERQKALDLKRKREAEERAKEEEARRLQLEEENRKREEARQERLAGEQKARIAQRERETGAYFERFPKIKAVYDILTRAAHIRGRFSSDQSDGRVRKYRMEFDIKECRLNKERHSIEIRGDSYSDKVLFYVAEEGFERLTRPGTGAAYGGVNCLGVSIEQIEALVQDCVELVWKDS